MDRASQAFADPRNHMVDSQVRPNKVTDPRILAAMRHLPRERFVPHDRADLAYADADVPLGAGRVLIEPMVIARLLQLAAVAAMTDATPEPAEKPTALAAVSVTVRSSLTTQHGRSPNGTDNS